MVDGVGYHRESMILSPYRSTTVFISGVRLVVLVVYSYLSINHYEGAQIIRATCHKAC